MTRNYPSYWNENSDFQMLVESYRIKIQNFFLPDRYSYSVDPQDVFTALGDGKKYDYCSSVDELKQLNATTDIKALIFYKLPVGGWKSIEQWSSFIETVEGSLDDICNTRFIIIYHEAGEYYNDPQEEWFIAIS